MKYKKEFSTMEMEADCRGAVGGGGGGAVEHDTLQITALEWVNAGVCT